MLSRSSNHNHDANEPELDDAQACSDRAIPDDCYGVLQTGQHSKLDRLYTQPEGRILHCQHCCIIKHKMIQRVGMPQTPD